MIEKLKYRGTRGKVEIIGDRLSVVFDIKSPQTIYKIRKALGSLIPTPMKFYWETAPKNDMYVSRRGIFKDTFKFDGEYAVNFKKEELPAVLMAIGNRRCTPAQLAQLAVGRAKRPQTLGDVK